MKSSDASKNKNEVKNVKKDNSRGWAGNFILMMELRKKILTFRDIIDLPPCDGSASINEVFLLFMLFLELTTKSISSYLSLSFLCIFRVVHLLAAPSSHNKRSP